MKISELEVLDLVKQVDKIYACVGKKVVFFDLKKEKLGQDELFKAVCHNGKLRAPTLRKGRTMIVGFDEATYSRVFS